MSFFGFDFCVQLVWIVFHKVCDIVYSYEREKTMFDSQFFNFKMVPILLYMWIWTITKLLTLGRFHIVFKIILQI
jgi:hypothetical protein